MPGFDPGIQKPRSGVSLRKDSCPATTPAQFEPEPSPTTQCHPGESRNHMAHHKQARLPPSPLSLPGLTRYLEARFARASFRRNLRVWPPRSAKNQRCHPGACPRDPIHVDTCYETCRSPGVAPMHGSTIPAERTDESACEPKPQGGISPQQAPQRYSCSDA